MCFLSQCYFKGLPNENWKKQADFLTELHFVLYSQKKKKCFAFMLILLRS